MITKNNFLFVRFWGFWFLGNVFILEIHNIMLDKHNKKLEIINPRLGNMKKNNKLFFVLGVLICLFGAGLMFDGAVLGEMTTNIATVLGIMGIGFIASQKIELNSGGE